jgi:Flp pilus assembly protein TadG
MKNWIKEERGQQVVMVALLLPVLLAVIGLVIDLGMVYARRQQAQNAADAAALAGAAALCTDGGQPAATTSANDYVTRNGFAIAKAPSPSFSSGAQNFTSTPRRNPAGG